MPVKKKKRTAKKKIRKLVKKRNVKKPVKKASGKKTAQRKPAKAKEKIIGLITHYFPKVRAAVIKLKSPLSVGDTIKIFGHTTNFTQTITSLQLDRTPISSAKKGQEIGLLVNSRVRQHDKVYKA